MCGRRQRFSFFPQKCCFLSHLYQVEWKTRLVNFFPKIVRLIREILRIMIKVFEVYRKSVERMEVATQPSLHFSGVSPGKTEQTLNIPDTIQPIFIKFSPKWSRCVWSSNSWNRSVWKCRIEDSISIWMACLLRTKQLFGCFETSCNQHSFITNLKKALLNPSR